MLQDAPIRRKLMTILLLVSAMVLLITGGAFMAYETVTFRQVTVRHLSTLGDIVGANSTAALAFDNHDDAQDVLTALRAESHIVGAAIYDKDGKVFATYPQGAAASRFPTATGPDGFHFEATRIVGWLPVMQAGKRVGSIYLESDLGAISDRFKSYAAILVGVTAITALLGYFLAQKLQRQISLPVLTLAETAKSICERRDFSVRAAKGNKDELGALTVAFNQMLDRIQTQLSRLDLLSQTTRAIGERQDMPSICQVVVRSLEDHLPIDFGCACFYDASRQALKVVSVGIKSLSLGEELGMENQAQIPIDENGLSRCVRGHLVYEPDISTVQAPFPQRLAKGGLRSLVVAPLAVESNIFGVLIAARLKPHAFDSTDCEFLKQLSEHTALAAHQAQLYNALQQAYDDLRQTQQAVMDQERLRALGQMASGIAHDINNAISPIGLYTESLLETEPNLSAKARDYLSTIQHAIEDVAQTVSRMKEFYRQRETQLILHSVALNPLIDQVVNLSRARWNDMPQQRGVTINLTKELAPDLPAILGIESEIREALINLIFNAVDAMPEGGKLTLRTRAVEDHVHVEVSDSGVGMNEETRQRCLEPFFTTKGERGTGLGLAMVYGTARRHNANIELDSVVGKGTTVRLIFPVAQNPGAAATTQAAPVMPSRARILLVDDDPLLIKSLRDTLETDGHLVTAATGGQAGIDTFLAAKEKGQPYAIVISDLGMPNVDGRKVSRAIKEASPTTPIILLTGWGQRLQTEGDIPPHVDRVLSKPPKLRDLREALVSCLESSANHHKS
jgi:signal transduction histidine kinase/CheY-like chemotaxis protein/uncharacterized membrane protein affecting hemolysin expression